MNSVEYQEGGWPRLLGFETPLANFALHGIQHNVARNIRACKGITGSPQVCMANISESWSGEEE